MIPQLVMAGIGIGLQAFGSYKNYQAQKETSSAQNEISQYERQAEAQKRQLMELDANRKNLEILRNSQKARALGLSSATAQGAGQGSGLQGGYGQIAGDTGTNLLGVFQNLEIGRNIFGINANISQQKERISNAQTTASAGSGLSSLGASLLGSAGAAGNLFATRRSPQDSYAQGNYTSFGGPTGAIY